MTGSKISALPAVVATLSTDIFAAVQNGITSRETVAQLLSFMQSNLATAFVPLAGGSMTGPLILSVDPTLALGAATKEYVDTIAAGFTVILSCAAATTANLNATPAGAGVGATLTNAGAMAAFAVDGYSASANDRILVKNQTLSQHNGIYVVTTLGSGAANWVLTRATDYDQAPTEIKPGTLVAVNNGTVNATTSWLETATVVTVDTDPILFSQFSFGPASFLLKANNLSDLPSVATALVNLGLGTPTGTGNVVLQTAPTLVTPVLGVASATSLTFGGSVLNTYQEGTFVPTITGSSANPTSLTYSVQLGKYTRIGNLVHYFARVTITALTIGPAAGNLQLTGLPYTSNATANMNIPGSATCIGLNVTGYTEVGAFIVANTNVMTVVKTNVNSASVNNAFVPVTALGSNADIVLAGFYFI